MAIEMDRISVAQKPIFYASVNSFLALVPGFALSLFGGRSVVLPQSVVEFIFPFSILPQEKWLVVALVDRFPRFGRITSAGFQPDVFSQQFFVLAFLFFFLVLIVLTLQAGAGALYAAPDQRRISPLVKALVVLALLRIFLIYILVVDVGAVDVNLPTETVSFHFLRWTAPGGLIMITCCVAAAFWQLLLMGWLRLADFTRNILD